MEIKEKEERLHCYIYFIIKEKVHIISLNYYLIVNVFFKLLIVLRKMLKILLVPPLCQFLINYRKMSMSFPNDKNAIYKIINFFLKKI
jgi:hypothetical protein